MLSAFDLIKGWFLVPSRVSINNLINGTPLYLLLTEVDRLGRHNTLSTSDVTNKLLIGVVL